MSHKLNISVYQVSDKRISLTSTKNSLYRILDDFGNTLLTLLNIQEDDRVLDVHEITLEPGNFQTGKNFYKNFIVRDSKIYINLPDLYHTEVNLSEQYLSFFRSIENLPQSIDRKAFLQELYNLSELFRLAIDLPEDNKEHSPRIIKRVLSLYEEFIDVSINNKEALETLAGKFQLASEELQQYIKELNPLDNVIEINFLTEIHIYLESMLHNHFRIHYQEVDDMLCGVEVSYNLLAQNFLPGKKYPQELADIYEACGKVLKDIKAFNEDWFSGDVKDHPSIAYLNQIDLYLGSLLYYFQKNGASVGFSESEGELITLLESFKKLESADDYIEGSFESEVYIISPPQNDIIKTPLKNVGVALENFLIALLSQGQAEGLADDTYQSSRSNKNTSVSYSNKVVARYLIVLGRVKSPEYEKLDPQLVGYFEELRSFLDIIVANVDSEQKKLYLDAIDELIRFYSENFPILVKNGEKVPDWCIVDFFNIYTTIIGLFETPKISGLSVEGVNSDDILFLSNTYDFLLNQSITK